MKRCTTLLVSLLLGCLAISAMAQTAAQPESEKLETMLEELDRGIVQVRTLGMHIDSAQKRDREALVFRRDERTFHLLTDLDGVIRQAAELPADDPLRLSLEKRLGEDLEPMWETLFARIEELGERIGAQAEQLDSLSGSQRVATEAYVNSLETLRLKYYEALVAIVNGRQVLGLPTDELQERIQARLYLSAEVLAGRLEFSADALQEVQGLLAQDAANADLDASARSLTNQQQLYLGRLERTAAMLESLGLDDSAYKSVLIQQSDSLSLEVLESGVVLDLVRDGWAKLRESIVDMAPDIFFRLLIFLLVLFVFRILSRLTKRAVGAACDRPQVSMSALLRNVLVSISGGTVMAIGILMALSQIGISLGPMLAGLGVAGFVVGFALQDTLGNFAAGSMILIYRPYDVDDYVEVAGASGFVKKMSLVSTTITTFDNQTLVVPNSKIWGDVIKNVTAQKVRRVDLEFGIGYGDDVAHAERVLEEIIAANEMVLDKPEPQIKLSALADSSVNFVVRPWVKTEDYWDVYFDVTREVKLRFDSEGISIPFPQRDIHLFNEQLPASDA